MCLVSAYVVCFGWSPNPRKQNLSHDTNSLMQVALDGDGADGALVLLVSLVVCGLSALAVGYQVNTHGGVRGEGGNGSFPEK